MKIIYTILVGIPLLLLLGLVAILSIPLFLLCSTVGLSGQYLELSTKVGNEVCEKFKHKVSTFS